MPIYEFFCQDCNTIFNFFSKTVDTKKRPLCPRCGKRKLTRQVSMFAFTGKATEGGDMDDLPIDESRMEKAMDVLSREVDHIDEDDPRQAANLMRKLTDMTGLKLGPGMSEALERMEKGEDPEQVEAEMGDLLESEDPFVAANAGGRGAAVKRPEPTRDETLYDL
ncbi:MAG: zinc ribbon domain-containing protein [Deltaproteobacteria bacterium]|nr:zinc ribbon domain-containing protein [Deltaproteobacteria bacterium]